MTSQQMNASNNTAANQSEGSSTSLVTPQRIVVTPAEQRLIEEMKTIYENGVFHAQDKHEVNKVKQVTRKIIFPGLKFCRGEGSLKKNNLSFGMCHERINLTKKCYANTLMEECGLVFDNTIPSIKRRTNWWKTYGHAVKREIRRVRSAKNMHVRDLVQQVLINRKVDKTARGLLIRGSGCPGNLSCRPAEEIDEENKDSDVLEVAAARKRVRELLEFVVGNDLPVEKDKPPVLKAARARFADMRITHPAHFDTFVEVALVGFVPVKDWRNKAALVTLSNIFTVADEAFAMLALENQIDDLVELVKEGASASNDGSDAETEKKVSKPRYTKMPVKEIPKHQRYRRAQMKEIVTSHPAEIGTNAQIVDNVFQGWSPQGVVRYNTLRAKVKKNREHVSGIECDTRNLELFKNLSDMKESDGNDIQEIDEDLQGEVDEFGFDEFSDVVMFTPV